MLQALTQPRVTTFSIAETPKTVSLCVVSPYIHGTPMSAPADVSSTK